MPSAHFPTQEEAQAQLVAAMIARGSLYDVSPTSVILTLCSGIAQLIDQLGYAAQCQRQAAALDSAAGQDLDLLGASLPNGGLTRIGAQSASVSLTFSRAATSLSVNIPANTQVVGQTGLIFSTTGQASIAVGQTFISGVPAICSTAGAGASGNVAANTVTQFASVVVGVDSVTNPLAAIRGADSESDDSFRQRIRLYLGGLSRSTPSALKSAVLGVTSPTTGSTVLSAATYEDVTTPGRVTLYIADASGNDDSGYVAVSGEVATAARLGPPTGTAQGGETQLRLTQRPLSQAAVAVTSSTRGTLAVGTTCLINRPAGILQFSPALTQGEKITVSYTYITGLIAMCQRIIDGDPTDRINFPGYRAGGIQVTVQAPEVIVQSISANISTDPSYSHTSVITQASSTVSGLLQGLGLGDALTQAAVISAIYTIPGVTNVTLLSPSADLLPGPGQIVRPGAIAIG